MSRASKAFSPVTAPSPPALSRIFVGTSGWAYPTWKPDFYPAGTPAKRLLEFYASQLTSVEVNHTFRTLPSAAAVENWIAATPLGFRFSFKAPQRITHFKRLIECAGDLAEFFATVEPVRQAGKLGLLLFQLPPNFKADAVRLAKFLATVVAVKPNTPPMAFEFRDESWFNEDIYEILRSHNAALCIADTEDFITPEVHTSSVYTSFRLRRTGGYSRAAIDAFARKFKRIAQTRDTYVYFKHEDEPTGALNAVSCLAGIRAKARRR